MASTSPSIAWPSETRSSSASWSTYLINLERGCAFFLAGASCCGFVSAVPLLRAIFLPLGTIDFRSVTMHIAHESPEFNAQARRLADIGHSADRTTVDPLPDAQRRATNCSMSAT